MGRNCVGCFAEGFIEENKAKSKSFDVSDWILIDTSYLTDVFDINV